MASVTFQRVSKSYGRGEPVVRGLDLHIEDGEFIALVGPSGCGKSTTLNLIAGFEAPSSGTLRIDGEVVNTRSPKERGVAMVFQSYALYPHMSVRRNIAFPLEVAKMERRAIEARVQEIAALLGISDLLDRSPRELSGGQRQRVALGRALVRRPRLCLFDEPLSNLDAALRAQMRAELKKLHENLKATFIYVTHDQAEAMTLSDRIVVLHRGVVQQVAPPREIYDRPRNSFVASFIGAPRINLLRPATLGLAGAPERVVGIRPEHLSVSAARPAAGGLRGVVYVIEPMGAETWVTVEVAGERVVARAAADYAARSGDEAWLRWDEERLLYFDAGSQEAIR